MNDEIHTKQFYLTGGTRDSQGELSVRRDHDFGHEVRVACERSVGVPVLVLAALKLPHYDALVARRGDDHVGVLFFRRVRKSKGQI